MRHRDIWKHGYKTMTRALLIMHSNQTVAHSLYDFWHLSGSGKLGLGSGDHISTREIVRSVFICCFNNHFFSLNWIERSILSGIRLEKISILRVLKKKIWTPPRFLHRGPKKAVEHDSDIHFDLTWAKKIRNGFLCKKLSFLL